MRRRIRAQPPFRLLELPVAARRVSSLRLVPRNGDVNEPLEEVALVVGRRAPCELELFMRFKVRAAQHQGESPLVCGANVDCLHLPAYLVFR